MDAQQRYNSEAKQHRDTGINGNIRGDVIKYWDLEWFAYLYPG